MASQRTIRLGALCCCAVFWLGACTHQPKSTDLAALQMQAKDKVAMKRAAEVSPEAYWQAQHFRKLAKQACDRGDERSCDQYAKIARNKMTTALEDVRYENELRRNAEMRRQKKTQVVAQVQQQQQQQVTQKQQKADRAWLRKRLVSDARETIGAAAVMASDRGVVVTLRNMFGPGDATVRPRRLNAALKVSDLAIRHPSFSILIEGHTDSTGTADTNATLSLSRATAIKREMTTRGVSGKRLLAAGWGEAKPLGNNATLSGRQKNRRIEIVFVVQE